MAFEKIQKCFIILYGSQTGQAEAIGEQIEEGARSRGFQPKRHCMCDTIEKFDVKTEDCAVIVVSSTGDGDPPENAAKFWKQLCDKSLPDDHLKHLHYALLGLGDSNYNTFGGCPKMFDKRLQELGARHFYKSALADDGVGLEIVVEPWIEGLWPALSNHIETKSANNETSNTQMNNEENIDQETLIVSNISSLQKTNIIKQDTTESVPHTGLGHSSNNKNNSTEETATLTNSINIIEVSTSINSIQKTVINNESQNNTNLNTINNSDNVADELKINNTETLSANISNKAQNNSLLLLSSSNHKSQTIINCTEEGDVAHVTENSDKNGETEIPPSQEVTGSISIEQGPTLTRSLLPLSECGLSLPPLPPAFLNIVHRLDSEEKVEIPTQCDFSSPIMASVIYHVPIISAQRLTQGNDVKTTLCMTLDMSKTDIEFEPGDAFGIIPQNSEDEVNRILARLGVLDQADDVIQVQVLKDTKKKAAAVPPHIPVLATFRFLFTYCLEIRAPIKKALLRMLAEHASDTGERRRLEELSSREGSDHYIQCVLTSALTMLDLLLAFPSAQPPITSILEHVPRLQPRSYSLANCPLQKGGDVRFVFNVVDIPMEQGRMYSRLGVCTGWLSQHRLVSQLNYNDLEHQMVSMDLEPAKSEIRIFKRANCTFHLPANPSVPVILIGPGVGVAPFLGFLQRREALRAGGAELGACWLFYGCRHRDGDYLFREEMDQFVSNGVLKRLLVCFSRDPGDGSTVRYVQDNIRRHHAEIVELICDQGASVYVCGDAKNMAKDVHSSISDLLQQVKGWTKDVTGDYMKSLQKEKRYLQDVWT